MKFKLKSSAKKSRRYLLIEGRREDIERAVLDYVGILGWAKAAPEFVSSEKEKVIFAINREELNWIRGAFEICGENIKIIKISGTIKGLTSN